MRVNGKAFEQSYAQRRPQYERLCVVVQNLLTGILSNAGIDFMTIEGRAKTVKSAREKLERKRYRNPDKEMTDLAGVRIVTYLEADVPRVSKLICEEFAELTNFSVDKNNSLGVDRVGYRSLHHICKLTDERTRLAEYKNFTDFQFEVQIRTGLQHTWAQIEHDRNYKFGHILPQEITRRLFLAAGLLEIVDREFSTVAAEIEEYSKATSLKVKSGELDIEIDTASLHSFLSEMFHQNNLLIDTDYSSKQDAALLSELSKFGLKTINDLSRLFTPDYFKALKTAYGERVFEWLGVVRDGMMYYDLKRYFSAAWQQHWFGTEPETVTFLMRKYTEEEVRKVFEKHEIESTEF